MLPCHGEIKLINAEQVSYNLISCNFMQIFSELTRLNYKTIHARMPVGVTAAGNVCFLIQSKGG